MKKILLLSTLSLALLVSCKGQNDGSAFFSKLGKSEEEKLADFNKKVEELSDELQQKATAISENALKSEEQKRASIDSVYNLIIEEYKSFCLKTIKKNKNNSVGLEAFKAVYSELEAEELDKTINMLGQNVKQDPSVQKIIASVKALENTAEGKMFVDFEVDGVKFSDFIGKGKYVLVDFWASWCGPCKREIPNIAKVYATYASDKFDVLSVAVWDKKEDTIASAKEHGVVWNQIINAQRIPTDLYGIQGIPQIMLFGPDGTILKRDLRGAGIEAAVKEALGL